MYRIGIVGYGNLGRACEKIAAADGQFELVGIFTRRDPASLSSPFGTPFSPTSLPLRGRSMSSRFARAPRTTL